MSHTTDVREGGWWPLQHHDPERAVGDRQIMGAVRLHPIESDSIQPPARSTYGDIQGGLFWEESQGRRDYLHSWWLTSPAVLSQSGPALPSALTSRLRLPNGVQAGAPTPGGGWLPYRRTDEDGHQEPDDRYTRKGPSAPKWAEDQVFPRGWPGIIAAGSDETAQHEALIPGAWGLVAVNHAGDPKAGTSVYDLDAQGQPDRRARLQSLVSVVQFGAEVGAGSAALGLQLGRGGRLDGTSALGYMLLVDHDSREVSSASARMGGPLLGGGARGCAGKHLAGYTADGYAIRPTHLSTTSLWIADGLRDGVLDFDTRTPWHVDLRDLPHKIPVYIRWNEGGDRWSLVTTTGLYFPDPQPPPPKPPPPKHPPPLPPLPPPGGEEDEQDPNKLIIWTNLQDAEEFRRLMAERSGDPEPERPRLVGSPERPEFLLSTNVIAVPGLAIKAVALAAGQPDPTTSRVVTDQERQVVEDAPQVGQIVGVAAGDGTWDGFDLYALNDRYSHAKAPGTLLVIPPDVELHQIADGTATTKSPVALGFPTGLAETAWGTLNADTGKLGNGVVASMTSLGLTFVLTDQDGEKLTTGPTLSMGEGGVRVGGKLTVTGRLDPTTVEFTDTPTDFIPLGKAGFRFDSTTTARPLWKEPGGDTHQIAYLSDVGTPPPGAELPPGAMVDFAGTSAPTGFLLCDGSLVSRATYADLFAAIGETWGAGDGSTTFRLPDFRRRVAVGSGGSGSGTLGNAVGNTGGAETHTLTTSEIPSHTHEVFKGGGAGTGDRPAQSGTIAGGSFIAEATGGGGAHNNIQPSAVVLKIIKT
ncbi:MAG: tail fiber protein [Planctomycetes bacterium]|nr:tail fiber protein [Planctomycetota bacterium]